LPFQPCVDKSCKWGGRHGNKWHCCCDPAQYSQCSSGGDRPLNERQFNMSLAFEFKEWFRKSYFSGSAGASGRFNKLCKRLETLEARPTANNKQSVPRCENCGGKLVTTCVNKKCDWSPVT
jgi:hypothetical protein